MLHVLQVYSELENFSFVQQPWNYLRQSQDQHSHYPWAIQDESVPQCAIVYTEYCPLLNFLTLQISTYFKIIANEGVLNYLKVQIKVGIN